MEAIVLAHPGEILVDGQRPPLLVRLLQLLIHRVVACGNSTGVKERTTAIYMTAKSRGDGRDKGAKLEPGGRRRRKRKRISLRRNLVRRAVLWERRLFFTFLCGHLPPMASDFSLARCELGWEVLRRFETLESTATIWGEPDREDGGSEKCRHDRWAESKEMGLDDPKESPKSK